MAIERVGKDYFQKYRRRRTVGLLALLIATLVVIAPLRTSALEAKLSNVWQATNSPSPAGSWYAVDFADDKWVALGHGAVVAISLDGTTWTEYPAPGGSWQSVTYGNGEFVALSSAAVGPEEMVSPNGIDWTVVAAPAGPWSDLTFDNGLFVAVGARGQIFTSEDAQSWTQAWSHPNYDLTSVAYGDGHFVAVDSALGATLISATGASWSRIVAPRPGLEWGAVAYGNGTFVAFDGSGADAGYFETSVSGFVWTLHHDANLPFITAETFGCGTFVGVGGSPASPNTFISSSIGATWSAATAPPGTTPPWSSVAYGAHRFVAVDASGDVAWTASATDCAAEPPSSPRQVSGNVRNGEVWTYMHPSAQAGGAPITSYLVTLSDGAVHRECSAALSFQPNCIIKGLRNHQVYWLSAQAHNRFGYSASADPEFVIPVASAAFSATTTQTVISQTSPVVVQITGVTANSQGIYPTSLITLHFGANSYYCHPNPFGECLITIANPTLGTNAIYATYSGYGHSFTSPITHVTITP